MSTSTYRDRIIGLMLLALLAPPVPASAGTEASVPPITLVAAPRGSDIEETALYAPIAAYLTQRLGRPVRYVYIDNWLSYRKAVADNAYDLYFNGPHFSSWLINYRQHRLIARLPEQHTFVVIVSSNNAHVQTISDLSGRRNCLHAPPNLGTEIFNRSFENPARQPYTIPIHGWKEAFTGVVSGQCDGAVLPDTVLNKLNGGGLVRVIHRYPAMPNQAITANGRLPTAVLQDLQAALLDPVSASATAGLMRTYSSTGFVAARLEDYTPMSAYLQDDFILGTRTAQLRFATDVTARSARHD